jgi:hypothetical protein
VLGLVRLPADVQCLGVHLHHHNGVVTGRLSGARVEIAGSDVEQRLDAIGPPEGCRLLVEQAVRRGR